MNPYPLQSKHRVLTTGPLGKSVNSLFILYNWKFVRFDHHLPISLLSAPGNHHSTFCFYNRIAFNRTISFRKTWIRECYFMSLASFFNSSLNVWEMMWWGSSLCGVPSQSPKPRSKSGEIHQTDFNSGTFYQTPNYSPTKLSRLPRTREVLENVTDQSSLRRNDWPVTCYLYSLSGILGEKKNAWSRKNQGSRNTAWTLVNSNVPIRAR